MPLLIFLFKFMSDFRLKYVCYWINVEIKHIFVFCFSWSWGRIDLMLKMYYYCLIWYIRILKIFPLLSFNIMQFLLGTRRYFLRFRNILEMIACGGKEKKVNPKASNCLYIKVPQRTCLPWQPLTWMTFLTRFNFSQFMYRTKKKRIFKTYLNPANAHWI